MIRLVRSRGPLSTSKTLKASPRLPASSPHSLPHLPPLRRTPVCGVRSAYPLPAPARRALRRTSVPPPAPSPRAARRPGRRGCMHRVEAAAAGPRRGPSSASAPRSPSQTAARCTRSAQSRAR
eukprot:362901-Chlamydomonas_euryale.AAC.2